MKGVSNTLPHMHLISQCDCFASCGAVFFSFLCDMSYIQGMHPCWCIALMIRMRLARNTKGKSGQALLALRAPTPLRRWACPCMCVTLCVCVSECVCGRKRNNAHHFNVALSSSSCVSSTFTPQEASLIFLLDVCVWVWVWVGVCVRLRLLVLFRQGGGILSRPGSKILKTRQNVMFISDWNWNWWCCWLRVDVYFTQLHALQSFSCVNVPHPTSCKPCVLCIDHPCQEYHFGLEWPQPTMRV